ncbi:hypothetical protein [Agaribacter flavus]|uniref:Uncharacterized protein n=1 Tax=Agaribacter flavus TaxID=1902781 RepID=A0ABV7FME4_9ALTE
MLTRLSFNKLYTLAVLVPLMMFAAHAQALIQRGADSLESIGTPHFDSLRVAENASIPKSRKIYIAEVSANFGNDWLREFKGKTTEQYKKRVLADYSKALKKHLVNRLSDAGWQVLDKYESGALIVDAQLKDLYINGPEKLIREHILVRNIGQSSILISVAGADNNVIFEIEDRRNAGGLDNYFIETDNAINYGWFSQLMDTWAGKFVVYLDASTSGV